MKTNRKSTAVRRSATTAPRTAGGAIASKVSNVKELERSVLACMLWEDSFYESGESIAERISKQVANVPAVKVAEIARRARTEQKLRHIPLLIVREMARLDTHKHLVADTLFDVIQRPDEITEFISIYQKT